jgi:hypothetical protein
MAHPDRWFAATSTVLVGWALILRGWVHGDLDLNCAEILAFEALVLLGPRSNLLLCFYRLLADVIGNARQIAFVGANGWDVV